MILHLLPSVIVKQADDIYLDSATTVNESFEHPVQRFSSTSFAVKQGGGKSDSINPSVFSNKIGGLSSPSNFTHPSHPHSPPSAASSKWPGGNGLELGSLTSPSCMSFTTPYFSLQAFRSNDVEVDTSPFAPSMYSTDSPDLKSNDDFSS